MAEPLRLLLPMQPGAAERVVEELRRGAYAPDCARLDTCAAIGATLKSAGWDIVIVADAPGGIDVLEALAAVREGDPDLPVVVVDVHSVPAAVAAMRAGAADCLAADELPRLAPAVRRAIQAARERRQRRHTVELRDPRAQLLDHAAQAVIVTDIGGTIRSWNRAAETLYGWPAEEALGRDVALIVPPDPDMARRADQIMATLQAGSSWSGTFEVRRRDGSTFTALVTDSPIYDDQGRLSGIVGISVDIGERKRAAEQQARLAAIAESVDDAVIGLALDATIMSWNRGAIRLYGWTAEEAIGQHVSLLVPPDRAGDLPMLALARQRGDSAARFESVRVRKDGSAIDVAITVSPIQDDAGAVVGAASIARDVSERKRAEEALRASETRFRSLFEHAPLGIALTDTRGRALLTNRALQSILGYDEAALRAKSFVDVTHPDDVEADMTLFRELLAGTRDTYTLEKRYMREDGRVVWGQLARSVTRDRDGTPQTLIAMLLDVTERRAAEERLRDSEARYRRVVETAQEGIWEIDAEDRTTFVNPAMATLLGYTADEMLRRPYDAFIDESGRPIATLGMARRRRGRAGQGDVPYRRKDGSILWAHVTAAPLFDTTGRYSGALALLADITARKQAEEALRRSERHFRALIEHSFDAILLTNAEGRVSYVSPSLTRILGYTQSDLLQIVPFTLVHPDEADALRAALGDLLGQPGGQTRATCRLRHRDGAYRWVEMLATNLLDEPSVAALVLNMRDITEQRQADDLRRRLAAIVETSIDAIFSLSLDGIIESWNDGAARLFGYSREEAVGAPISLLAGPDRREEQERLATAARQGTIEVVEYETVRHHRDGHPIDVTITRLPLRDDSGRISALSIVVRDITARKRAEEEEQRARAVADELARLRTEREREARAVAEVGAALAHELDPRRLYQLILAYAAELLPCDHAHMRLYQDGWVMIAAAWGNTTATIGARLFPLTDAAGNWMPIARDTVVRIDDTADVPFWVEVPPYLGERRAGSTLIVPIVIDGEAVGSLTINSRRTHAYTDHHLWLAGALGDHLTLALRNARLYAREQERARAAEELVRVRNDFVAAVSHELRTPLTAVIGYAELLRTRWPQLNEERRLGWLAQIVAACNRQRHLVEDLLTLTRVESGTLVLACKAIPVRAQVEQTVGEMKGIYPEQRIDVDGPDGLSMFADAERVVQILAHLMDNAAKYSQEGSPIEVSWAAAGDAVIVRVRDHGPGLAEAGRELLFTRFGRLPGSRMRAGRVGTGLGLHLGRELARAMGGELDLEATGPEGSTFRLRLPRATGD